MEDLLTPQICMDVDDTPLDVGNDSSDDESGSRKSQVDDDEKVKRLLELEFNDPSQVPDPLTDFEKDAMKNVFAVGEPAIQFHRLHCTACNVHLGSAPIAYFDRFIHPLLKVILCKSCYEFYCSGEFDKDEDGSEMYCRWCGQGGKVMCCASCAYVFCQKCVRQNLGKKTLEIIKDSDDWQCFGCNPPQLISLRIICFALYEFTLAEIRLSKVLSNSERLKVDHSMCCNRPRAAAKRKRGSDEDETYTPFVEGVEVKPKPKRFQIKYKSAEPPKLDMSWTTSNAGEELVCAPDLSALMNDDKSSVSKIPTPTIPLANKENNMIHNPALKAHVPKPLYQTIAPRPSPVLIQNVSHTKPPGLVRFQSPSMKLLSALSKPTPPPIVNSIPAQLVPGLRHHWFEKAATVVSTINGSLSFTLDTLTKQQKEAKTVRDLATVHNKLQELLSTSVNSLIQVRKSLRNEFLTDLNKLKFTQSSLPPPPQVAMKPIDDDVIIVGEQKKPEPSNGTGRPYLKVRSVSQLLKVSAECITIPDDPVPEKVQPKPSEIGSIEIRDSSPIKTESPIIIEETNKDATVENLDVESEKPTEETTPEKIEKSETKADEDMSQYDEDTYLMIKNALAESKIDQLVQNNLKYETDFSTEELLKILSVRVCIATKFRPHLPNNRLKTAEWFNDDIEEHLACAVVPILPDPKTDDDKIEDKRKEGVTPIPVRKDKSSKNRIDDENVKDHKQENGKTNIENDDEHNTDNGKINIEDAVHNDLDKKDSEDAESVETKSKPTKVSNLSEKSGKRTEQKDKGESSDGDRNFEIRVRIQPGNDEDDDSSEDEDNAKNTSDAEFDKSRSDDEKETNSETTDSESEKAKQSEDGSIECDQNMSVKNVLNNEPVTTDSGIEVDSK